jgi:hypothetical protein
MARGAGSQKRKKRGSGDVETSSSPSAHNFRPRGHPPPPVYYLDDIEMSDRVERSDDDVEDPSLNFELNWRQKGVGGGGNDSDGDSAKEEEEEQRGGHQQLGRPYITEPNYPSYRGPINYYQAGMANTVVNLRRTNPANEDRTATDYRFRTIFQQDYYTTVVITGRKAKITNDAQYVDWEFLERKNNPIFDEVIQSFESEGINALMGFKQQWNKELIT